MSAPIKIKYNPLSTQSKFHQSQKSKVALIAGYGFGKTHSLVMHHFKLANLNRGCQLGLLCPTLKMAKRDVMPTFQQICRDNKIIHDYNKSDFSIYLPQTKTKTWILHGEDDGQSIRGPNLACVLINEFTLINEATYLAAIARIRDPKAKFRQLAMSGTFEEFGGVYDLITNDDQFDIFYGSTRENTHLPDSYVKMLESTYDSDMQKQYIEGQPVRRLGKAVCKKFSRSRHVSDSVRYSPEIQEIWISVDFNVDPMSAVIWAHQPNEKVKLLALESINLKDSDTPILSRYLTNKLLEEYGKTPNQVSLFPDPAGAARKTVNASKTDLHILRDFGFSDLRYTKSIRSVKDCVNSLEAMLDRDEIKIHPQCKDLIDDLEQVKWKDNGFEFDKTNPKRSHWIDSTKNMIHYAYPALKPVVKRAVTTLF